MDDYKYTLPECMTLEDCEYKPDEFELLKIENIRLKETLKNIAVLGSIFNEPSSAFTARESLKGTDYEF